MEYYINIGKKDLKLKEDALMTWVSTQMEKDEEREIRALQEAERVRQHEIKAQQEAEKERQEAEKVRQEAERVRQHELLTLEKKIQLAEIKEEGTEVHHSTGNRTPRAPAYKFSHFNEKLEDLDTWFTVFEKQCKAFDVPDEDRKGHLFGLLSGKYRDTLLTLDDETYEQIRNKMLKTYNLTADGYRTKFFNLEPTTGETITAYTQRLQACIDKWISLANIDRTFEALKDMLVTHQIFQSCNPLLIKFLLERNLSNTVSILDTAGSFFSAHPELQLAKPKDEWLSGKAAFYHQHDRAGRGSRDYRNNRGRYGFGGQPGRGNSGMQRGNYRTVNTRDHGSHILSGKCYYCSQPGHFSKECPRRQTPKDGKRDLGGSAPCELCKIPGHSTLKCRKLYAYVASQESNSVPGKAATPETCSDTLRLPMPADVANQRTPWREQHVYPGLISQDGAEKVVTVLRDTGSAVHAVHADLITNQNLIGRSQQLVTFGGSEESFPLAKIHVDTPFISGEIIVCVLNNYPEKYRYYDVLIGNGGTLESPIALDPSPDIINCWRNNRNVGKGESEIHVPCQQVTTRSETKRQASSPVPDCLDLDISHADLASMQRNDPSLSKYFKLVGEAPKEYKTGKKVSKCAFELRNCVLVRIFSSFSELDSVQILVPTPLRAKIMSLAHDTPFNTHRGISRTLFRLSSSFCWPGISSDVEKFCKSCVTCLKKTLNHNVIHNDDLSFSANAAIINDVSSNVSCCAFETGTINKPEVFPMHSASVSMTHDEPDLIDPGDSNNFASFVLPSLKQKESVLDVPINNDLNASQKTEIYHVPQNYSVICSDVPSKTDSIKHTMKLYSYEPISIKQYPFPFFFRAGNSRGNRI